MSCAQSQLSHVTQARGGGGRDWVQQHLPLTFLLEYASRRLSAFRSLNAKVLELENQTDAYSESHASGKSPLLVRTIRGVSGDWVVEENGDKESQDSHVDRIHSEYEEDSPSEKSSHHSHGEPLNQPTHQGLGSSVFNVLRIGIKRLHLPTSDSEKTSH